MPPCSALTKDASPCRAHGTSKASKEMRHSRALSLCPFHTHFYDSPATLFNLATANVSPYTTTHTFAALTRAFRTASKLTELVAHINERFNDMVRSPDLVERDKVRYIYEIAIQAGVITPLDASITPLHSAILWMRSLSIGMMSLRHLIYGSNTPLDMDNLPAAVNERLGLYMDGICAIQAVKWFLNEMVKSSGWTASTRTDPVACEAWIRVLDHLLSRTDNRTIAYYDFTNFFTQMTAAGERYRTLIWNMQPTEIAMRAIIRREQLIAREQLRGAIDPLKEELMVVAWHPDRVAAAMAAGLMPEDM